MVGIDAGRGCRRSYPRRRIVCRGVAVDDGLTVMPRSRRRSHREPGHRDARCPPGRECLEKTDRCVCVFVGGVVVYVVFFFVIRKNSLH